MAKPKNINSQKYDVFVNTVLKNGSPAFKAGEIYLIDCLMISHISNMKITADIKMPDRIFALWM